MALSKVRALALVADSLRGGWFASELAALDLRLQVTVSVSDALTALLLDPQRRPQLLFVDFDPLSALDVLQLNRIREHGWFGVLIAFGKVSADLRTSLDIEHVLPLDTDGETLRTMLVKAGFDRPTSRMAPLRR